MAGIDTGRGEGPGMTTTETPEAQAIVAVGDFVRFDTAVEGNWPQFGIRVTPIEKEFNANSPMRVVSVNLQLGIAVCVRDRAPAGTWPMGALVKVTAPVSNPPAPMVPDAL